MTEMFILAGMMEMILFLITLFFGAPTEGTLERQFEGTYIN
jgi:hypothetical protein